MGYKEFVKGKWDNSYSNKKNTNDEIINNAKNDWNKWIAWIKSPKTSNKPEYWKLDMANKYVVITQEKVNIPKNNSSAEEKQNYKKYKSKCSLRDYIIHKKRKETLGAFLVDEAQFFCGGSVQFSFAFGVAVKYCVDESFKRAIDIPEVGNAYSNKIDSPLSEDEWSNLLDNEESWIVKKPIVKDGKSYKEITEDEAEKLSKEAVKKLNELIEATDMAELEGIEKKGYFSAGMRHKIMMLQTIRDENKNSEIANSLLFKNDISDNIIEKYIENNDKRPSNNWVSKSSFVLKKLYQWTTGINKKSFINTRNLGALAWNLSLNEDYGDIDNENYKQIIFTGAPGTGKTFGITEYVDSACLLDPLDSKIVKKVEEKGIKVQQSKFVQFHSSYDYSDFVEGLRPVQLKDDQNPTFVRMDGVFKKFCRGVAEYNIEAKITDKKFYFIIDEINRADLGKVFGELMYGLEESYRGKEHAFDTQYMNLPTYIEAKQNQSDKSQDRKITEKFVPLKEEDDVFAKGFYIPENVRIIGSMNDIDRSVETFDFALRRRFQWKDVPANDEKRLKNMLESMFDKNDAPSKAYGNKDELVNRIRKMNKVISGEEKSVEVNGATFNLNESYQIGGAYFKTFNGYFSESEMQKQGETSGNSLEVIWNEKVEPALREYVRGRQKDAMDAFVQNCKDALLPDADKTDEKINNEQEENEVENEAEKSAE